MGVEIPQWLAVLLAVALCVMLLGIGWIIRDGKATQAALKDVRMELRLIQQTYWEDPEGKIGENDAGTE